MGTTGGVVQVVVVWVNSGVLYFQSTESVGKDITKWLGWKW